MTKPGKSETTVHAVQTSLRIINAIQELETPTVTSIAKHLDIPKSTAFNHIHTLENQEYLVDTEDEGYRLGLRFLDHGVTARDNLTIYEASSPTVEQLADETDLAVWLGVEEYGRVVCVRKGMGERAVPTRGRIGRRLRMHSGSLGKAILAHLPAARIDEIIEDQGLPQLTENTITDSDALQDELNTIRQQGVAFNDGESMAGLRAVASPIFKDSTIQGAICAAGTRNRMKGEYFEDTLPARVKDAANEIELKLTYES